MALKEKEVKILFFLKRINQISKVKMAKILKKVKTLKPKITSNQINGVRIKTQGKTSNKNDRERYLLIVA